MTADVALHAAGVVLITTASLAIAAVFVSRLISTRRARERHDFALAALVVVPLVFSIALLPIGRDASPSPGNTATGYFGAIAQVWMVALSPALLAIWALGSLGLLTRLAFDLRAILALRARAVPVPISEGLSLSRQIAVQRSTEIVSPMLIGYRRPTIVVPEGFILDAAAVPIMEHEIAHARRGDNWTTLAVRILAALMWWNVPVYFLRRIVDRAREEVCDDCAVALTGAPHQLAKALLDTAADAVKGRRCLAAATNAGALAVRVQRLMSPDAATTSRPRVTFVVLAPLLGLAAAVTITSIDMFSSRSKPWRDHRNPSFSDVVLNTPSADTSGSWHCGFRDVLIRGECYFVIRGVADAPAPESKR